MGEEVLEAGPGAFVFLPHGVPHSYTLATDEVRMLGIVAPGGLEGHFRDPRFAEPAESPTLPPAPVEPPDAAILEEVAEDVAGYDTQVVAGHQAHPSGSSPLQLRRILLLGRP